MNCANCHTNQATHKFGLCKACYFNPGICRRFRAAAALAPAQQVSNVTDNHDARLSQPVIIISPGTPSPAGLSPPDAISDDDLVLALAIGTTRPGQHYRLYERPQDQHNKSYDGPLAQLGFADQDYQQIDTDEFKMNGVTHRMVTLLMTSQEIMTMALEQQRQLAVKCCQKINSDLFSITYTIINVTYILDPWDWDYPIP